MVEINRVLQGAHNQITVKTLRKLLKGANDDAIVDVQAVEGNYGAAPILKIVVKDKMPRQA